MRAGIRLGMVVVALALAWPAMAVDAVPRLTRVTPNDPLVLHTQVAWEIQDAPDAWLTTDVNALPVLRITAPDGNVTERALFIYQAFSENPDPDISEGDPEFLPQAEPTVRVRHAFRRTGRHEWALIGPDGVVIERGAVTVAAGSATPGPVRVHPANPRLLATADGEPLILLGCNVAWAVGPQRLTRMRTYLDALADAGGNHVRVWCASWSGQIEGGAPDRYRMDHAWLLDQVLDHCRARGLHVTLVLDNHHDIVAGWNVPYGGSIEERIATFFAVPLNAQYQRRLRYLVARYGAHDAILAWELVNEIDEVFRHGAPPEGQSAEAWSLRWTEAAAAALRAMDPDQRLITISLSTAHWPAVLHADGIDLAQVHSYVPPFEHLQEHHKDAVAALAPAVALASGGDRPVLFGEVGYQGTNDHNDGHQVDPDGWLLRRQAWAGFLVGGVGTGMNWWWDTYIHDRGLWSVYTPMRDIIARIDWRDPGLAPVQPNLGSSLRIIGFQSPDQALLMPQVRTDTWYNHLVRGLERPVFDAIGPVVTLSNMRPGVEYDLRLLDQVTTDERRQRTRRADELGNLMIILPADCRDLVILVSHDGGIQALDAPAEPAVDPDQDIDSQLF